MDSEKRCFRGGDWGATVSFAGLWSIVSSCVRFLSIPMFGQCTAMRVRVEFCRLCERSVVTDRESGSVVSWRKL